MIDRNDYYAILGVTADADQATIKQAYRALVRRWHPDVRPDDPRAAERFRAVTTAYQMLSQPLERQRYDAARRVARSSPPSAAWPVNADGDGQTVPGGWNWPPVPPDGLGDLLAALLDQWITLQGREPHLRRRVWVATVVTRTSRQEEADVTREDPDITTGG